MPELPWAVKQLARVRETTPELVDAAIAQLFSENRELRWSVVVSAYLDGEINLGKAAELLGQHELELRDRFRELGLPLRWGPANLAEARAEAEALEAWLASDRTAGGS